MDGRARLAQRDKNEDMPKQGRSSGADGRGPDSAADVHRCANPPFRIRAPAIAEANVFHKATTDVAPACENIVHSQHSIETA